MTAPPALAPDTSSTGRPADIRVSKAMRHRIAGALVELRPGMSFADARAVIAQHAGDSVDEIEAYLQFTFRLDPTGVTAVRRAMRGSR